MLTTIGFLELYKEFKKTAEQNGIVHPEEILKLFHIYRLNISLDWVGEIISSSIG